MEAFHEVVTIICTSKYMGKSIDENECDSFDESTPLNFRMGRGPAVTDREAGRIVRLHEGGVSERAIADRVGRSRGCVRNVLAKAKGGVAAAKKKTGPKLKVSERDARLLVREASKTGNSARKVKAAVGVQ
ncbi:hypothetical protein PybrP1_004619, partial [[Pythium] brassicae (nom. inval.)]